jgi:hypothetical protein
MTWDTTKSGEKAVRLDMGLGGVAWAPGKEREISAVDWGRDLVGLLSLLMITLLSGALDCSMRGRLRYEDMET